MVMSCDLGDSKKAENNPDTEKPTTKTYAYVRT